MSLFSPRMRFITACILLQAVLLAVLAFNTHRIWAEMVQQENERHIQALSRLLQTSFMPSMVAGNRVRSADLLDSLQATEGIDYLVLLDAHHQVIAARGWDISKKLPADDLSTSAAESIGRLVQRLLRSD